MPPSAKDEYEKRLEAGMGAAIERIQHVEPRPGPDEVIAIVEKAFADHGAPITTEAAQMIARDMVGPDPSIFHPIRAHRDGWRLRRPRKGE